MKIRPVGAELLHEEGRTDGRTDRIMSIVVFRNFSKTSKNLKPIQSKVKSSPQLPRKLKTCKLPRNNTHLK